MLVGAIPLSAMIEMYIRIIYPLIRAQRCGTRVCSINKKHGRVIEIDLEGSCEDEF